MAIKKSITFEGLTYNLDDRDRVAAAAAINQSTPTVAFAAGAGSIAGTSSAGVITVGTQSTNTNDITVTFGETFANTPTCLFNAVGVTNFTLVETASGFYLDVSGNTSTGTVSYHCLS